ncbi:unnamed protein product [Amoebophrya sp. A120]|nr:unnamed protein product [Amoebophrya sp. A120]|eukprot:GSA120T00024313001.1
MDLLQLSFSISKTRDEKQMMKSRRSATWIARIEFYLDLVRALRLLCFLYQSGSTVHRNQKVCAI